MTPDDLMRWTSAPELRKLSLAARAAWLLLMLCERRILFSNFVELAAVTPKEASAVLTELIDADLVHVDNNILTPGVLALPLCTDPLPAADDQSDPASSTTELDGYAAWMH